MTDFHGQMMNIQRNDNCIVDTYACGHRDARHAAAEIALKADAKIERLRAKIAKADALAQAADNVTAFVGYQAHVPHLEDDLYKALAAYREDNT